MDVLVAYATMPVQNLYDITVVVIIVVIIIIDYYHFSN